MSRTPGTGSDEFIPYHRVLFLSQTKLTWICDGKKPKKKSAGIFCAPAANILAEFCAPGQWSSRCSHLKSANPVSVRFIMLCLLLTVFGNVPVLVLR